MKKRILVIDDDEELCEETAEILKDQGYQVDIIFNGIKGKAALENNSYDILILDMKIPGMNGYEILKFIKEKKINLKTIVVTGRPVDSQLLQKSRVCQEEEQLLKTADGFINKPFDIENLLKKIRTLIAKDGNIRTA